MVEESNQKIHWRQESFVQKRMGERKNRIGEDAAWQRRKPGSQKKRQTPKEEKGKIE